MSFQKFALAGTHGGLHKRIAVPMCVIANISAESSPVHGVVCGPTRSLINRKWAATSRVIAC